MGRVRAAFAAVRRALRAIAGLRIGLHAASAGFFIVLSVFPALVLILSLLRYTPVEVQTLLQVLAPVLPDALEGTARDLVLGAYANSSRAVVGISALTGLWSASRGVQGLLQGLNAVYGVTEHRGYLRTRAISMVYTLVFLLMLLLTLMLHVFGTTVLQLLPRDPPPVLRFFTQASLPRFLLLLGVLALFFCLMYRVLPDRPCRFWENLPGAMASALGWVIFSDLFSLYVEHFPRYSAIFGSVYAVALSMLWLYCCLSLLFYGGVLNRILAATP